MLKLSECKELLEINSRTTIGKYLKTLGLEDSEFLNWHDFERMIRLQSFLGLNRTYSYQDFLNMPDSEIDEEFQHKGVNISDRLNNLKQRYEIKYKKQPKLNFSLALEN